MLRYTPAKAQEFQRAVVRRLEALAGVESVSLIGTGWVVFGQGSAVSLPGWVNDARLCVRVKGDPAAMLPVLAREVHAVDSGVPIAETITLPVQLAGAFRPLRMSATFVGYAGGLTALLSVVGLYGALAFTVSRRRKEIGIRMALGAESSRVLAFIVREGMTVIFLGVIGGLSLATGAARFLQHLLYGSSAGDVSTYVGAALVVAGGGVLASWIPARRAASVDPVAALKEG